MRFEIKEIVLWPRRQEFEPRRLKFHSGKVNVISGNSRTGKSAAIPTQNLRRMAKRVSGLPPAPILAGA